MIKLFFNIFFLSKILDTTTEHEQLLIENNYNYKWNYMASHNNKRKTMN